MQNISLITENKTLNEDANAKNKVTISEFLGAFFPNQNDTIYLRSFKPKQADYEEKSRDFKTSLANLPNLEAELHKQNKRQGMYFVVNSGGRTDKEIKRYTAVFVENDNLSIAEQNRLLDNAPLLPSIRVETKKSVHAYWLLDGECSEVDWRELQVRIIGYFKGDTNNKNPSRLLRLPFFNHVSYDRDSKTYRYKCVELAEFKPERRYKVEELLQAFPKVEPKEETPKTQKNTKSFNLDNYPEWTNLYREIVLAGETKATRDGWEFKCPICGISKTGSAIALKDGRIICRKSKCRLEDMALTAGIDVAASKRKYYEQKKKEYLAKRNLKRENNMENEENQNTELSSSLNASENIDLPALGMKGRDFMGKSFSNDERILFGVRRGQVGMLNAPTNVGKSVFFLNLMLVLTSGMEWQPFIEKGSESGLRVMLIDGESSKNELQNLLLVQIRDWSPQEQKKALENIYLICDVEIDDETLNLTNPKHRERVEKAALEFKPDLILVDTMSALFDMDSENDNAEVKRKVMKPLKNLARNVNAAAFMAHHIGKMNEDSNTSTKAYSGRGGSAFGALARTVINLTADKSNTDRVIFSMPKIKGQKIEDVVLQLSRDSFWFRTTGEQPPKVETSYTKTVALVNREMTTSEIVRDGDNLGYSKSSIEKHLKEAIAHQDIKSVRRGVYAPIETVKSVSSIGDTEITVSGDNQSQTITSVISMGVMESTEKQVKREDEELSSEYINDVKTEKKGLPLAK